MFGTDTPGVAWILLSRLVPLSASMEQGQQGESEASVGVYTVIASFFII